MRVETVWDRVVLALLTLLAFKHLQNAVHYRGRRIVEDMPPCQ